jgi:hypothetical protein
MWTYAITSVVVQQFETHHQPSKTLPTPQRPRLLFRKGAYFLTIAPFRISQNLSDDCDRAGLHAVFMHATIVLVAIAIVPAGTLGCANRRGLCPMRQLRIDDQPLRSADQRSNGHHCIRGTRGEQRQGEKGTQNHALNHRDASLWLAGCKLLSTVLE